MIGGIVKINAVKGSIKNLKTDMFVVGVFEDAVPDETKILDNMMNNEITGMIKSKEFKPEFKEIKVFHTTMPIRNVLTIGLGKKKEFNLDKIRKASAVAAKAAKNERVKKFTTVLHNIELNNSLQEKSQAVTEGILLGLYKFEKYKTPEKDEIKIETADLLCENANDVKLAKNGISVGTVISEAVNYVRDITNEPSSFMTPTKLAEEAKMLAKKNKLKIKIFGRKEIIKMGFGGLLGVSKGSTQEPKFIVLEYKTKTKKKVAIVGKGVTFDSGGINLKENDNISIMRCDKAGAAAVLGIMNAASKLKVPVNIIGLIPATENMPSGSAIKPGDILTAYNKKTIEIVNTDAEGRLILADALSYAEKNYKPDAIIDLATLTLACIVALGYDAAGVLGTDENLIKKVYDAGQKSSEKVWQLPLWEEYKENVKSEVADVKNSSGASPGPGVINGAAFLNNFIEKTPWVHIDIAGIAWIPEDKEYVPKNATGFGVRLITQLLMDWE